MSDDDAFNDDDAKIRDNLDNKYVIRKKYFLEFFLLGSHLLSA